MFIVILFATVSLFDVIILFTICILDKINNMLIVETTTTK